MTSLSRTDSSRRIFEFASSEMAPPLNDAFFEKLADEELLDFLEVNSLAPLKVPGHFQPGIYLRILQICDAEQARDLLSWLTRKAALVSKEFSLRYVLPALTIMNERLPVFIQAVQESRNRIFYSIPVKRLLQVWSHNGLLPENIRKVLEIESKIYASKRLSHTMRISEISYECDKEYQTLLGEEKLPNPSLSELPYRV